MKGMYAAYGGKEEGGSQGRGRIPSYVTNICVAFSDM